MTAQIATLVFALGIVGLFLLDRDRTARTSKALWIPVVWVWIALSRPISEWLTAFGVSGVSAALDSSDRYLEGSPVDRNVFMCLLAVGVVVLISRRRQVGTLLGRNAPILLFFSYCALSVFWSDYPDVAFKRWIKALGDVVMILIVVTDAEPLAAVKRLLARVGFLLVPLSVLFIKYYPDLGRTYNHWTWELMVTGVTTGKNLLGMTCLTMGLGSTWRFLVAYGRREDAGRTRRLVAHGAVIAMVMWLFWKANSMTSLACFLLGSALIVATRLRMFSRKPSAVHLLVAAVVFASFFALFLNPGGELVGSLGRDASLTGRTAIWDLVLGMSGSPLFGTGFESFWLGERLDKAWQLYKGLNEAHNGYLEVYLNLGWVGLTLLALVMLTGYRNAVAAFRYDPEIGSLRLAYFSVAVVYNFTEAAFRMLDPVWIFFLLATISVPELAFQESLPPLDVNPTTELAFGARFREEAF